MSQARHRGESTRWSGEGNIKDRGEGGEKREYVNRWDTAVTFPCPCTRLATSSVPMFGTPVVPETGRDIMVIKRKAKQDCRHCVQAS